MSLNDTHSLERTLDYCEKSNDSFLNTTLDCSLPNNLSNISTVSTCPSNVKAMSTNNSNINNNINNTDKSSSKSHIHFNRLWSVWYGIIVTLFQGYLIVLGLQKYLGECSLNCGIKYKIKFISFHFSCACYLSALVSMFKYKIYYYYDYFVFSLKKIPLLLLYTFYYLDSTS
jgi:hypothetical protein